MMKYMYNKIRVVVFLNENDLLSRPQNSMNTTPEHVICF